MKRNIRAIAVVLLGFTASTLFAGGANEKSATKVSTGGSSSSSSYKYEKPITMTSFKISDVNLKYPKGMDINNNIWNQYYKDELNIDVKYLWSVPQEQSEAKINVNIAANDMPDLSVLNKRQMKLMVDNGMAADLTKIFEQHASPLVKETLVVKDNNFSLTESTINGKLYALPFTTGAGGHPLLYIRSDWLKKLNLAPPKSIDELIKVAEAFVNSDPDGNGKKDTHGLSMTSSFGSPFGGGFGFFTGFGAYPFLGAEGATGSSSGWVKDSSGKIAYGGIQPQVKSALAKLSEMYNKGLLDKEWATRDTAKLLELAVSGKLGLIYSIHVLQFQWPFPSIRQTIPEADWVAYEVPTVDGKPGKVMLGGSASTYFVVNKNYKNPEAAVKLLNLYAKTQYIQSPDYNEDFHVKIYGDNEKYMTWQWAALQNFGTGNEYVGAERIAEWFKVKNTDYKAKENPWIADMIEQISKYLGIIPGNDNMWHWVTHMWMNPTDGIVPTVMKINKEGRAFASAYTGADTQSMAETGSTLAKLRDQVYTQIIMGSEPITAFDKFVADWNNLGGKKITEEVNAAVKK